jgi:hypothetical protein
VVDGKALLNALNSKHLGGAALDVFPLEGAQMFDDGKITEDDPTKKAVLLQKAQISRALAQHPRVKATAHIGGSSKESTFENAQDAARKMARLLLTGEVHDGLSTADIDQLPGIFENGDHPTHVLSLMNEDVPGVHKMVDALIRLALLYHQSTGDFIRAALPIKAIQCALASSSEMDRVFLEADRISRFRDISVNPNKGAERTNRTPGILLASRRFRTKARVASCLVQYDLYSLVSDPLALQQMIALVSKASGVLRARLFEYYRERGDRLTESSVEDLSDK